MVNMVSIDLVHLLVRIQKLGSPNIAVFLLMRFVLSFSRLSRRGTFLGLVFQLQALRL
jgi:hypothetical protein